jgi:hypothetical protein
MASRPSVSQHVHAHGFMCLLTDLFLRTRLMGEAELLSRHGDAVVDYPYGTAGRREK